MAAIGDEIYNPRTGQRMVFRQTARETAGECLRIECVSPPSPSREPEHVHPHQESRFEVLSGTLHVRFGGRTQTVGPGDVVTIPANAPHLFWNEGESDAHYVQEFRPALNIDAFFVWLFQLAREGKLDRSGRPSMMQMAVSGPFFWNEIRVTSPPEPLQRLAYLTLGPVARLLGYRPT